MNNKYTNPQPLEYITKDTSLIRELLNPQIIPGLGMSVAEAVVEAHAMTIEHAHQDFDEIYWNITGNGWQVPIKSTIAKVSEKRHHHRRK